MRIQNLIPVSYMVVALALVGCDLPGNYKGKYQYQDETLSISNFSVTLSKGDSVEAACDPSFPDPASLYESATLGEPGAYVIPDQNFVTGDQDGEWGSIFSPETVAPDNDSYSRVHGCYESVSGHTCIKDSEKYFKFYCFQPTSGPEEIDRKTIQTIGFAFAISVDLKIDHKLQSIMVKENPEATLEARSEGDFGDDGPTAFISVGGQGRSFVRTK